MRLPFVISGIVLFAWNISQKYLFLFEGKTQKRFGLLLLALFYRELLTV